MLSKAISVAGSTASTNSPAISTTLYNIIQKFNSDMNFFQPTPDDWEQGKSREEIHSQFLMQVLHNNESSANINCIRSHSRSFPSVNIDINPYLANIQQHFELLQEIADRYGFSTHIDTPLLH